MSKTRVLLEELSREELIAEYLTLQENSWSYKDVFESMSDVVARTNMDGYIQLVSPSVFDVFGYSVEEVIGEKASHFYVDPQDRELIMKLIQENGMCKNFQSRLYTKDGTVKWYTICAKYYKDGEGNVLGIEIVFRDISQQKEDEEKLLRNTLLLNESQRLAHLGHISWSMSSNEINWSDELYRICGVDFDVIPSYEFSLSLVHRDDLSYVEENINLAFQGFKDYKVEHRIIRADNGEVVWVQVEMHIKFDSQHNLESVLGTILDVSEKKKDQKALLQSEEEFRSIYENTYSGIHLLDLNGNFLKANQRFVELLGYTEMELLGMNIQDITHPDDRSEIQEKMQTLISGEIAHFEVEQSYISKAGEELICNMAITAPIGIDGIPEFLTASLTDVTEERRVQEILKGISEIQSTFIGKTTSTKIFKKILKTLLIITQSESGYIGEVKEQDGELVLITHARMEASVLITEKISEGSSLCSLDELTKEVLATGKPLIHNAVTESVVQNPSSSKLENFMGLPFYNNSELVGIISVANKKNSYDDKSIRLLRQFSSTCSTLISAYKTEVIRIEENQVSERMKKAFTNELELKVAERTKDLQRTQRELSISLEKEKTLGALKSRFVSTASHQFRTPLTVIQSNMGILSMQKDLMDDGLKSTFEKTNARITSQIGRMTSMMNKVLILSSIDSGSIIPEFESVDLVELCEEIIDSYNEIQEDNRRMKFSIDGKPCMLVLDAKLMTHAISNFVSNAFKYSENSPEPTMRLVFDKQFIQLSIKDYGLGIPEDDLTHLFEPFYRASNVTEVSGTGLGTSIAKEYIELNNGTIDVNSTLHEGTEFVLTFKKYL